MAVGWDTADLAEFFDGVRQCELFAGHAADEAAAADFASGFEAAVDAGQLAPGGGVRFAGEEAAEDDAVAFEERSGLGFYGFFAVDIRSQERPATGAFGFAADETV